MPTVGVAGEPRVEQRLEQRSEDVVWEQVQEQERSAKPQLISYDQRDSVNVKQVFGHPTA